MQYWAEIDQLESSGIIVNKVVFKLSNILGKNTHEKS